MIRVFKDAGSRISGILFMYLLFSFFGVETAPAAESISFRVVALNPSATKVQKVQIKKYLPQEVKPKDVIDTGGLDIEYDTQKAIYYVYKNDLELLPKEIRVFNVEIQDIWIIPEYKLYDIEERVDSILAHLENTVYYVKGKEIADTIYPRLKEIRSSQADDTVSRQRHIGTNRENEFTRKAIEADIARMEKILVTAGGPPAPDMLAETKIKAESPSKTMTWIVIFIIIIFIGLLAGVLFFTWQQQARLTKEALTTAKDSAFPESTTQESQTKKPE